MKSKGIRFDAISTAKRFICELRLLSIPTIIFLGACTTLNVPAPPPGTDTVLPTLPPSHIAVEARVQESSLCAVLNKAVPGTISESPSHHCYLEWGVYKNGAVTCGGASNDFQATAPIHFRVGQRCNIVGVGKASCGFDNDPLIRAAVNVNAPVTWNGWHLESNPKLTFGLIDKCNITAFDINVTSFVKGKAQGVINNLAGEAPGLIKSHTDITNIAENAWKTAGNPIKLKDDIWLSLVPQDIGVSSPDVSGGLVSMSAALVASPVINFSSTAPAPTPEKPLPASPANIPVSDQFTVVVDGVASWDELSSQLSKALVGKGYSWGPFSAEPTAARAYGGDKIAVVAIDFKGSIKGTAYLQATPVFNQAANTLQLQNVEFTLATKNALAWPASWLLSVGIPAYLESQTYSLDAPLNKLGATLNPVLNQKLSPELTLSGSFDENPTPIQVVGVFVQSYGVVARVGATGTLKLIATLPQIKPAPVHKRPVRRGPARRHHPAYRPANLAARVLVSRSQFTPYLFQTFAKHSVNPFAVRLLQNRGNTAE